MKITIELTQEEWLGLRALAIQKNTKPEKIPQQFVSELTGSLRSRGSDERDFAENWFNRTFHRWEELPVKDREEIDRLQSDAYHIRQAEHAAWQKSRGILSK